MRELRERAGLVEERRTLAACTSARGRARLLAFEQHELRAQAGWADALAPGDGAAAAAVDHLLALRTRAAPTAAPAGGRATTGARTNCRRRKRRARRLVDQYLHAVVRVAQYSAYERVFALWHVAHLPFVYLLVISAVVHVIAVHAY